MVVLLIVLAVLAAPVGMVIHGQGSEPASQSAQLSVPSSKPPPDKDDPAEGMEGYKEYPLSLAVPEKTILFNPAARCPGYDLTLQKALDRRDRKLLAKLAQLSDEQQIMIITAGSGEEVLELKPYRPTDLRIRPFRDKKDLIVFLEMNDGEMAFRFIDHFIGDTRAFNWIMFSDGSKCSFLPADLERNTVRRAPG
jgi:hypothetical protein